jgi:hypothetical protein
MMATTHASIGMLVATGVAYVFPELAAPALVAGYIGGVFPDGDLLFGEHRKTLHYPLYYWIPVFGFAGVSLYSPTLASVAGLCFCLGAALHSGMDVFGAGVESRPWVRVDTRAVYFHPLKRWVTARYYIPYDGSPRDFALVSVTSLAILGSITTEPVRFLVVAGLVTSFVYTIVRRRLPDLEEWLLERKLLPAVFQE